MPPHAPLPRRGPPSPSPGDASTGSRNCATNWRPRAARSWSSNWTSPTNRPWPPPSGPRPRGSSKLDILVNNAGLMLLGPVENADTTDWTRMMDTNVMGLMYVTHAALPELIRNQGTIVQISSIAARVVGRGSAVYNATKFAVNGFSEGLRQEVTERGVRVVVIEPGTVETELREHITHAPSKAAITERVAKIRQLQSEDIADAVLYAVTAPPHATVNEIFIRPTDQA